VLPKGAQKVADASPVPPNGGVDAITFSDAQRVNGTGFLCGEGCVDLPKPALNNACIREQGSGLGMQLAQRVERRFLGQKTKEIAKSPTVSAQEVERGQGCRTRRATVIGARGVFH